MSKTIRFLIIGSAFLGTLPRVVTAQGPASDTVEMKLDREALVGSHALAPGDYTIRQLSSASNPRVLEFTRDKGTRLIATVAAFPVMQNIPPSQTKIDFDDQPGSVPRIRRIWVQGKTYGYEFPKEASSAATAPSSQQAMLEGRFQSAVPPTAEVSRTEPPLGPQPAAQQSTLEPQAATQQSAPEAQAAPQQTTPDRSSTPQSTRESTSEGPPEAIPQSAASTQAQVSPTPSSSSSDLPATSLNWVSLVLIGLATGGLGAWLFRRTAA